jgi:hypothetical protein
MTEVRLEINWIDISARRHSPALAQSIPNAEKVPQLEPIEGERGINPDTSLVASGNDVAWSGQERFGQDTALNPESSPRASFRMGTGACGLSKARTNLALHDHTLMAVDDGSDVIRIVPALLWQSSNDRKTSTDLGVISARHDRHRLPRLELVCGYHLGSSTNLIAGRLRISATEGLAFDTRSEDPATFPRQNGQNLRGDGDAPTIHARTVSPFRRGRR